MLHFFLFLPHFTFPCDAFCCHLALYALIVRLANYRKMFIGGLNWETDDGMPLLVIVLEPRTDKAA
jgi:hypothetical protein